MKKFGPCEICSSTNWTRYYAGRIRDGGFGNWKDDALVGRCATCGVLRLVEGSCFDAAFYETEQYREHLGQRGDAVFHYQEHDQLQIFAHRALWPSSFRGAVVGDIGAASGAFLDTVSGMADASVAIEPCRVYHEELKRKGYHVYPYASDALRDYRGKLDLATSFQVIEHVPDPRGYLEDIRELLAPGGRVMISTPNLNDILMTTAPEIYRPFFFRAAHRWYFDENSLRRCAELAGFRVCTSTFVHRYPLSNYLRWLRDSKPTGRDSLPEIDTVADGFWCSYLEAKGMSDTLFLECKVD